MSSSLASTTASVAAPAVPPPLIARRSTLSRRPSLPTTMLPTLPRSLIGHHDSLPATKLLSWIAHLRLLYATTTPTVRGEATDSGYASDDELDENEDVDDLGKDDQLERGYARAFLSSLIRKGEEWVQDAEDKSDEEEKEMRLKVIDEAAALVANLAETSASGSILRPILLPTCAPNAADPTEPLTITLNDALPSSLDPTSVGLQSWGSSILLARMIALDPIKFGVARGDGERTLELGAGTGLLSLVWKGMSERLGATSEEVIATDYHEAVLDNLRRNVDSNTPAISPCTSPINSPRLRASDAPIAPSPLVTPLGSPTFLSNPVVQAHKLDWSAVHTSRRFAATSKSPLALPAPFHKPFHTLLAADVVYGPEHASWLKSCVEQFLVKPDVYQRRDLRVVQAPTPFRLDAVKEALIGVEETARSLEEASIDARPSLSRTTTLKREELESKKNVPSPAFHLIVPLRTHHAKAISSIAQVFPRADELPRRGEGDGWRVGIKQMTELQRVKGVGRVDENSYRLYEIGWC